MMVEDEWAAFQKIVGESVTDRSLGWSKKVEQKEFKNGFKCTIY